MVAQCLLRLARNCDSLVNTVTERVLYGSQVLLIISRFCDYTETTEGIKQSFLSPLGAAPGSGRTRPAGPPRSVLHQQRTARHTQQLAQHGGIAWPCKPTSMPHNSSSQTWRLESKPPRCWKGVPGHRPPSCSSCNGQQHRSGKQCRCTPARRTPLRERSAPAQHPPQQAQGKAGAKWWTQALVSGTEQSNPQGKSRTSR